MNAENDALFPGMLFHVGTGGQYPGHNPHFTVDEAALLPAANLMTNIVETALEPAKI